MEILKEMYKKIPKNLLLNKWELIFMVSNDVFQKQKHLIHNNRFMGINVYNINIIKKDTAYLTKDTLEL